LNTLKSIEAIEPHHIFNTNTKPVLVHCNDLNHYVCKYSRGSVSASRLFREYIAASFLKLWGLSVPDFAFVYIKSNHLPNHQWLSGANLEMPCFGSLHDRNYKEIDQFFFEMTEHQRRRFSNKEEFLAIAFFDIWIGNDDRNYNNFNLLYSSNEADNHFVPFDHECCFNTGNLDKGLYTLSFEDSLLSTPLLTRLFTVSKLIDKSFIENLRTRWYLCTESCRKKIKYILKRIPSEWLIDTSKELDDLNKYLLTEVWFEECIQAYREHLQMVCNRKNNGNLL